MNLAIKYRPIIFEQVLGQNLAVEIAKASILAPQLHPTYLMVGPSGSGKTTLARIMARSFNCTGSGEDEPNPCNECRNCQSHLKGKNPDIIEIDAADKTGVDDVRSIIEQCGLHTITGNIRVYIIDEFHQMSKAAQNAMLKLLEEPPQDTVFILCTTEEDKIIETIKTRARILRFTKPSADLLVPFLINVARAENIPLTSDEANLIYSHNKGSVRKCLQTLGSIVENVSVAQLCPQIDSFTVKAVLLAFEHKDYLKLNNIVEEIDRKGFYPKQLLIEIIDRIIDMMPEQNEVFARKADSILTVLIPLVNKLGKNGLANCRLALYEAAMAWHNQSGTVELEPQVEPEPLPVQPLPNQESPVQPVPVQPVPVQTVLVQPPTQPVQPMPQQIQPVQPQPAPTEPEPVQPVQPIPVQPQPVQYQIQPPHWQQQPPTQPMPQPVQPLPNQEMPVQYQPPNQPMPQQMQPVQPQPIPQPIPQSVPQPIPMQPVPMQSVPNQGQNGWHQYS